MTSFAKIVAPGVILDTSRLDKITKEMRPKARQIVNEYGNMMMADAVKFAPIDTGALRNSIASESKMIDELTYRISDGVEYGVYQEFGTSKMGAQPFMRPAIDLWKDKFMKAFEGLFK